MDDFKQLNQKEMQSTEGGSIAGLVAVAIAILVILTAPPQPPTT